MSDEGAPPAAKKPRSDFEEPSPLDKADQKIATLEAQVASLQDSLRRVQDDATTLYASGRHCMPTTLADSIQPQGMSANHAKELIVQAEQLDFKPRLNTSSYVNVVSEPQERDVALLGLETNLADASVYPASVKIHDTVVNVLAKLWHAPAPTTGTDYCGSGTVGSTEACLLAGLAHKFRWRKWYAALRGLTDAQVQGIKPNVVISTCYQAAWEKFFRYFDVEPKFVKPNMLTDFSAVDAHALGDAIDDKTLMVVCILGNHYNGVYDHVWEADKVVQKVNAEKGFQVGIHIDGASGAFIAPFQEKAGCGPPAWDFRLPSVLSISASGHKFGESICGTGWVVFRHREDLAEHIAVSVTYLGGHCDSMTLNFSRPASGPYVQFYKFLRLGSAGYVQKVKNQMAVSAYLRNELAQMKAANGKPRFQILDGSTATCNCLPVVAARLNPELGLAYDDIDLQHALSESHWYVSGYSLGFEDPNHEGEGMVPLFTDLDKDTTMFRIVVKSNLTRSLAEDLVQHIKEVIPVLDSMKEGYMSIHSAKEAASACIEENLAAQMHRADSQVALTAVVAATKWLSTTRKNVIRQGKAKHPLRHGSAAATC